MGNVDAHQSDGVADRWCRDYLGIDALLVQVGREGPSTPASCGLLASEWERHVAFLDSLIDASPNAIRERLGVARLRADRLRHDIERLLSAMTAPTRREPEITRLAAMLEPLVIEHRGIEQHELMPELTAAPTTLSSR